MGAPGDSRDSAAARSALGQDGDDDGADTLLVETEQEVAVLGERRGLHHQELRATQREGDLPLMHTSQQELELFIGHTEQPTTTNHTHLNGAAAVTPEDDADRDAGGKDSALLLRVGRRRHVPMDR